MPTARTGYDHPYHAAVTALVALTCVCAAAQLLWFRRKTWLKAETPLLMSCIAMCALAALANGLQTWLSPSSYEYYSQWQSLFQMVWVYNYVKLLLTPFQPLGGGGRQELLDAGGRILQQAGIPKMTYMLPFRPFACEKYYVPGPKFLREAFTRIDAWIVGTLALNIFKNTLDAEGAADTTHCEVAYSGSFGTLAAVCGIILVLVGLTGILALTKVLEPLLTPDRHDVVALRHKLFIFMQTFTAIQGVLIFGVLVPMAADTCETREIQNLVFAIEFFAVQVASFKAFTPRFDWAWSRPGLPFTQSSLTSDATTITHGDFSLSFLVPLEEMASKFAPEDEADAEIGLQLSQSVRSGDTSM